MEHEMRPLKWPNHLGPNSWHPFSSAATVLPWPAKLMISQIIYNFCERSIALILPLDEV
jgi:hypothetical protein